MAYGPHFWALSPELRGSCSPFSWESISTRAIEGSRMIMEAGLAGRQGKKILQGRKKVGGSHEVSYAEP